MRPINPGKVLKYASLYDPVNTSRTLSRVNWVVRGRPITGSEQLKAWAQFQLTKFDEWSSGAFCDITDSSQNPPTGEAIIDALLERGAREISVTTLANENALYYPAAYRLSEITPRALEEACSAIAPHPFAIAGFCTEQFHPVSVVLVSNPDDYGVCAGPSSFVMSLLGDLTKANQRFIRDHFHDSDMVRPDETSPVFGRKLVAVLEEYNRAGPGYTVIFPQ